MTNTIDGRWRSALMAEVCWRNIVLEGRIHRVVRMALLDCPTRTSTTIDKRVCCRQVGQTVRPRPLCSCAMQMVREMPVVFSATSVPFGLPRVCAGTNSMSEG